MAKESAKTKGQAIAKHVVVYRRTVAELQATFKTSKKLTGGMRSSGVVQGMDDQCGMLCTSCL